MKHFIYFDSSTITSIVAQHYKGIIKEIVEENQTGENNSSKSVAAVESSAEAKVSAGIIANIKATFSGRLETEKSSTDTELTKEVKIRIQHDDIFDLAYSALKPLKSSSLIEIGQYIEIEDDFELVNLDSFKKMFSSKTATRAWLNQIDVQKEENERLEAGKPTLNKNEKLSIINKSNREYDIIHENINALLENLPSSLFLVSKNRLLVPLVKDFFRENPELVSFKYRRKMTCLGLVVNQLASQDDKSNVLTEAQNQLRTLLYQQFWGSGSDISNSEILDASKVAMILHPLALYFKID